MADKGRPQVRRKEKASSDRTKDGPKGKKEAERAAPRAEEAAAAGPEDGAPNGEAELEPVEPVEPMELPPFEIIQGDRIDPFAFKFQFKNVEYSSGRNKTFLCYLVDEGEAAEGLLRGYLEDEHSGPHAEEAFFTHCLQNHDPALRCSVTWYVSSSPCSSCAVKIAQVLKARTNVRLSIFAARLFEWEEPEIQAGLRALHAAGCKLRVMKPLDFSYTWETFVENEDQPLNLWEDCKDNYEFYQDKLADVLQ